MKTINLTIIRDVIKESLEEMDRCPNDSVQDIWSEKLKSWETGLKMNHNLEIVADDNSDQF